MPLSGLELGPLERKSNALTLEIALLMVILFQLYILVTYRASYLYTNRGRGRGGKLN